MFKKYSFLFGLLIVFLMTFLVWSKVLGQAFLAEGPYYFGEPWATQFLRNNSFWEVIKRYDLQSILFFRIFADIARDNMKFYFSVLLVGITFVNFGVFMVVKQITKNFVAGLIAASLFIANFVGSAQMLGQGFYVYFTQRVPNFTLALFALVIFVKFLKTKKFGYYLLSFALYALGIFLAHYTFLFFPLLLLYIFTASVFEDYRNYKNWILGIIRALPYLIWTFIFIKFQEPSFALNYVPFSQFVLTKEYLLSEVLSRLTILTVPSGVVTFFSGISKQIFVDYFRDSSLYSYSQTVSSISYLVGVLYLVATFYVITRSKNLRPFIISIFLTIPISIVMALYLRVSIADEYGSSRYLYAPSMFTSIFWGTFFSLIIKKGKSWKIITLLLITYLFIYQRSLIIKYIDGFQPKCNEVLATISYLRENYKKFPDNSLVILTKNEGGYHKVMFDRFYGERNIRYLPETMKKSEILALIKKEGLKNPKIFRLDYDTGKIALSVEKL